MKKSELQKQLDKRKYPENQKEPGFRDYCDYCPMRITEFQIITKDGQAFFEIISRGCRKSQEIRERYSLCGKAYIKRDHERRRSK